MSKLQDDLKEMRKRNSETSKKINFDSNESEKGNKYDKKGNNNKGNKKSKNKLYRKPKKGAFIFLGISFAIFMATIITYSMLNPSANIWGSNEDSLSDIKDKLSDSNLDESSKKTDEDKNIYIGDNVDKKLVEYNGNTFKIYNKQYTELGKDVEIYLENLPSIDKIDFTEMPKFLASEYNTFVKKYIIKSDSNVRVDDNGDVNIIFYTKEGKDNFNKNKEVIEKAYKNSECGIIYSGKDFKYKTEDDF